MAFDIKLAYNFDFDFDVKTVGTITCGSLNVGMLSNLGKLLKELDADGVNVSREVLQLVGRIKKKADDTQKEDGGTALSETDLDSLTETDIDNFAREFMAHNSWLLESYGGRNRAKRTDENGKVDFPKNEDERDSDYLARVLQRYLDEYLDGQKQFLERTKKLFATDFLLKIPFSISEQLGRSQRGVEVAKIINPTPTKIPIPQIPENPILETNRRLTDGSRKSTIFSVIAILLALASLMVTAVFSWLNYQQSPKKELLPRQVLEEQTAQIELLVQRQDALLEELIQVISAGNAEITERENRKIIEGFPQILRFMEKKQAE